MRAPNPPSLRPRITTGKSFLELCRRFDCELPANPDEVVLSGVCLGTADIQPGDLFVAVAGANSHGAQFVAAARDAGAVAVLTDRAGAELAHASGLPVAVTDDPRGLLGDISAWLYETESLTAPLFGITGTNGKTSTVHLLKAILQQMGIATGLSSTAERHVGGTNVVSGLTTPEATEMHGLLARMTEDGAGAFAIEVSAQALTRRRVDGIRFHVAGFTNLTHDHLDDYGDMRSYLMAKATLLTPEHSQRAVICLDTPAGSELLGLATVPVTTISSNPEVDADWHVAVTAQRPAGVEFTITARSGEALSTRIPIIGAHMAANAGLAIAMIVEAGYLFADVAAALEADGGIQVYIPGRSERVSGDRGPAIFVDFGHSPDAFVNTLDAVRQVTRGKVIMVFGADGDRDALKRPAMAEAAVRGSDVLIITDHHPRFENPASIRAALVAAARHESPIHPITEVGDPKLAIREAVRVAKEGDSILWAGPGHQNYRDIEGVHVAYSARQEARDALREAGWG